MRALAFVSFALVVGCAGHPNRPTTASKTETTIAPPVVKSNPETSDPPPRTDHPAATPGKRTATEPPPTHVDDNGDRVPVDFVVADLLKVLDPDVASREASTARILTWLVEVDDRPLVIDRVILWVHVHPANGADSWRLAHFYRHPLDDPPRNEEWRVSMVFDAPYVGQSSYSHAPTGQEMDRFLSETWWKFRPSDGFQFLDANVCVHAWRASLGSAPNHGYP